MTDTELVQTRLDPELKGELERFAGSQGTSVAAALRAIVADSLNDDGGGSEPGRRWKRVMVRFTTEEYAAMSEAAEEAGLSAAAWMRWELKKSLGRPALEERIRELEGRLAALEGQTE